MAAPEKHLLIARKDGKSSSRRQRAFTGAKATVKAITRWEAEGFNGFWVFGPATPDGDIGGRGLLGQWSRVDDPSVREAVLKALKEAK